MELLKEIEKTDKLAQPSFSFMDSMTTMGGVFYPKDYIVAMVWSEEHAKEVKERLYSRQYGFEAHLLEPKEVIRHIGRLDPDSKIDLPSVGTEGATVKKYVDLAREGHWAILVKAPNDEDAAAVVQALKTVPFSYAQRYHLLAMEDIYAD